MSESEKKTEEVTETVAFDEDEEDLIELAASVMKHPLSENPTIDNPKLVRRIIKRAHDQGDIKTPKQHAIMRKIYNKIGYTANGKMTIKAQKAADELKLKELRGQLAEQKAQTVDSLLKSMDDIKKQIESIKSKDLNENVGEEVKKMDAKIRKDAEEVYMKELKQIETSAKLLKNNIRISKPIHQYRKEELRAIALSLEIDGYYDLNLNQLRSAVTEALKK